MDKIIGYWEDTVFGYVPIVKKDDNKYYRHYTDQYDEFPKELYQYAMTTPWEKMNFYYEEKDGNYIAKYISPMNDNFGCNICGFGKSLNDAMLDLIANILDVMQGYDKEKVNRFMDK